MLAATSRISCSSGSFAGLDPPAPKQVAAPPQACRARPLHGSKRLYFHRSYHVVPRRLMRSRRAVTISLPPEMLKQMEKVRKAEHRTTSELVREAWRTYFAMRHAPVYTPTRAEVRAIERGRAAFRRG